MPDWLIAVIKLVSGAGIVTVLGGLVTVWVSIRTDRRAAMAASAQLNQVILNTSREQLDQVNRQLGRYAQELAVLREARFQLDDALTELRDMTIAARTLAHEYERRLGLPETAFAPLPRPGLPASPPAA